MNLLGGRYLDGANSQHAPTVITQMRENTACYGHEVIYMLETN